MDKVDIHVHFLTKSSDEFPEENAKWQTDGPLPQLTTMAFFRPVLCLGR